MRILLVTGSFPPLKCGVGDYSFNLMTALVSDANVHVSVLTSVLDGSIDRVDGAEVFSVMKGWRLVEILKFIKIVKKTLPDIVHIQYPTQGYGRGALPWILPLLAFWMRKIVVQTWHEGYSRRNAPKLFLKAIVPGGLIFVRPEYDKYLHSQLSWAIRGKRTRFIPNASAIPCADLTELQKKSKKIEFLKGQSRLVVFFGFIYPHKGVEFLFDIANPSIDQIVIAGAIEESDEYFQEILKRSLDADWLGKVTFSGFLPSAEVAALLSIADAVILPFRMGGGEWNTSIHGAILNNALVITTSLTRHGYDKKYNVYYADVDDFGEMKIALEKYAGCRREYDSDIDRNEWTYIAKQHQEFYKVLLSK